MTFQTPPPWTPPPRPDSRDITNTAIRLGANTPWYTDLYAFLLRIGWLQLLLLCASAYLVIHGVFACLYLLFGPCIQGARPGSWIDAYFFSVQTLSTIGYGGMTPKGIAGNLLVTVESMIGVLGIALATGLVFSKFARPTARVTFSRTCVIHNRNGVPCLFFRLSNERGTNIVEASLRVTILKNDITAEGQKMRRLFDANILRSFTPVFVMSWLVIHPIDEDSPLYQLSKEEILDDDTRIIITLTGIDGIFSQTVHAHHAYWAEDIMWDMTFVDMLEMLPDKRLKINYAAIHDLIPFHSTPAEDKKDQE